MGTLLRFQLHFNTISVADSGMLRRKACTCRYSSTFLATKFNHLNVLSSQSLSHYSCRATLSSPTLEVEKKQVFGEREASLLVKELRQNIKSGKTRTYEWRVSQLKAIYTMIDEKEKEITRALYEDLEKPEMETFVGEISRTKASCEEILAELHQWMKPVKVKTAMTTYPSSAEIVSEPLGVALVISTWNFPFLLSMDPVIGAIAAGNAVVLKPSEIAPATSSLLSDLFKQYLDPSFMRVVEGAVPETTALLEQRWDLIFYTGSAIVGRIIMAAAAKHLTPVVLELGGKSPTVVDANIDLKVAVRRIIAGKWQFNSGQACIGVDYIITTKAFAPTLVDGLKKGLAEFFGDNLLETKEMSRIVSLNQFNRLCQLMDEENVSDKIVFGGQRDKNRLKIAPTILLDVPDDSQIMQEEIFGPLLPVVTVEELRESFEVINSKPKPLVAYLFTNDESLKKDFVQNVSSGGMLVNDTVVHVSVPNLPFGGVGESGMGSYHGKYSFDAFSHKKSVLYRSFQGDAALRYPPYTPEKQKLLKAVIKGGIWGLILAFLGFSKE